MCGSKSSQKSTPAQAQAPNPQEQMAADAARARAAEEARAARIRAGQADINKTFGSFNDSFFGNYENDYLDYYTPQIDGQFGDANEDLAYSLARSGLLKSSVAGEKSGDLSKAYSDARSQTLARAKSAVTALRGRVANEKSSALNLLNATGDADRAASEALSRSQLLFKEQPEYNPLGDLFGGFASGIGNLNAGKQARNTYDSYFGAPSATDPTGSTRIVR
jgi:hypothetical protein